MQNQFLLLKTFKLGKVQAGEAQPHKPGKTWVGKAPGHGQERLGPQKWLPPSAATTAHDLELR